MPRPPFLQAKTLWAANVITPSAAFYCQALNSLISSGIMNTAQPCCGRPAGAGWPGWGHIKAGGAINHRLALSGGLRLAAALGGKRDNVPCPI